MTQERTRRLAAVWFADVVGYTELSARDEDLALRVVRELQRLTRIQCTARGGRIVKLAGDGILTVFESADGAVRAAVNLRDSFLQSLEARSAEVSLRIGIHVGDVTEGLDGDVYGDAVNAASRIEGVAEPGQVLMSEVAYRLLQQRSSIEAEPGGEHDLKGIGPTQVFVAKSVDESSTEALQDLLQDELAPLQLLSMEGMGGMGAIYLARDPGLRRTLAVKVLRTELVADKLARARFIREAQIIAGLSHPNVLGVHTVGELKDGTPYFVMDYVEGGSLEDRVEAEGSLSVAEGRRALGEVASALAAAHRRGVVHRDIKASNVLFDRESGRCLVSDWGIAALDPSVELSPETRLTKTGMVIGSPKYMSPEQLAGDDVGPESDVYSLGLLAFELLTGQGPFTEDTPRALMVSHLREEPPTLSSLREDVDPELSSLVSQCLAKSPDSRPSAERIASRLAPGSSKRLEWPPPGLDSLMGKVRSTGMWALLGMAMISLPVVVALVYPLTQLARFEPDSLLGVWLVLLMAAFAGLGLVAFAAFEGVRMGLNWRRGLSLGYGWLTLADVASDHRGDTGTLITGGKEYVSLTGPERGRLRRLRILGAAAPFVAVVALIVSQPVALMLAGGSDSPWTLITALYLPTVLVLLAGAGLESVELRRVGASRNRSRRHRLPHQSVGRLVIPWYESVAAGAGELGLEPGPRGSAWVGWAVLIAAAGLLGWGMLTTLPVGMMSVVGPLAAAEMRPNSPVTQDRIARLQVGRSLRLEPDSTIDAVDVWFTLISSEELPADSVWLGRPDATLIAGSPLVSGGPLMSCSEGATRCSRDLIHPDSALITASRGLTEAEYRYLSAFGHNPRFPLFSALARATRFDELRLTELQTGPPLIVEGMTLFDLPLLRVSATRELAYYKIGYAAAQYSAGDLEGAEETLRELVSVGLLMADDGTTLLSALMGLVFGELGIENLRLLYTLTGRLEAAAALQNASSAVELEADLGLAEQQTQESFEVLLQDASVIRQLKREFILPLLYEETCTTPRGLFMGPGREVRELLEGPVREELVRYPLEAQVYQLMLDWESNMSTGSPNSGWGTGIDRLLSLGLWAARVTSNERLAACINFGAGYF